MTRWRLVEQQNRCSHRSIMVSARFVYDRPVTPAIVIISKSHVYIVSPWLIGCPSWLDYGILSIKAPKHLRCTLQDLCAQPKACDRLHRHHRLWQCTDTSASYEDPMKIYAAGLLVLIEPIRRTSFTSARTETELVPAQGLSCFVLTSTGQKPTLQQIDIFIETVVRRGGIVYRSG